MQSGRLFRPRRGRARLAAVRLALLLVLTSLPLLAVVPAAGAGSAPPVNDFHWDAPALFGTTPTCNASSILKGPSGSLYAVGPVGFTVMGFGSISVERMNAATGGKIWRAVYAGYGGRGFLLQDAASDAKGNVIVVGATMIGGASQDWQVVKYSAAGKLLWVRVYNGPAHSYDVARAVAVDAYGCAYVCGVSTVGTDTNVLVMKYDAAGKTVWKYTIANAGADEATDIALDSARNSYVCVILYAAGGRTCHVLKLSPTGGTVWRKQITAPGALGWVQTILVRGSGVYVVGAAGLYPNTVTLGAKYSLAGVKQWIRTKDFDGADNVATGTVDAQGNLIVVGSASGSTLLPGDNVGTLVKWSSAAGTETWSDELMYWWGGGGPYAVHFYGVATDSLGRVFCTGSMNTGVGTSAIVMRYPAGGTIPTRFWEYKGSGTDGNGFYSLLALSDWQMYAGGSAQNGGLMLVEAL